jgi:hypothetical protein
MSKVPKDRFPNLWLVDTEYVSLPGEQQRPVCLVAHGFNEVMGQKIELFFDRPQPNPFTDPARTLFIAYNVPSEFKTMLSLGWELPAHCIDLYVEFLNLINGKYRGKDCVKDLGTGLVDAVSAYGGNPFDYWKSNKGEMRDYIMRYGVDAPDGVTPESHRRRILDYCSEDVLATIFLGQQMFPHIDVEQALWRGRYCRANAYFEHNGVPIDKERFDAIESQSLKLKLEIAKKIEDDHHYGVYEIEGKETTKKKPQPVFKIKNFATLLESKGITVGKRGCAWRATPTGGPMLEDDYFGDMTNVYPDLEPLRQCRKSLNSLSRFKSVIGDDGFNRSTLWMFGTVTSRNNPKAKDFLLSRPHWVRNLLTPREGMALIACDVTGAEDWLAAGFSGDPELMRIYSSGADSYMEFASVTGAVPMGTLRDKTSRELELIRAQHKTAKLAIQYGVGGSTLAKYLGVPIYKSQHIINSHKQWYSVYWAWTEAQAQQALERGYVITDFGWRQSTERMTATSILNYPQQAGCAELLRGAAVLLVDQGWGPTLAAPHHDAIYTHCPIDRAEECKAAVMAAFVESGHVIMGLPDFPLRVHASITNYPDHYVDPDGSEIWTIVTDYFNWDQVAEGAVQ